MRSPSTDPRLRRRPVRFQAEDLDAALLVEVEPPGDVARDRDVAAVEPQVAADDAAVLHELRHDPPGHVDRDGEADPLRRLDDRGVDADDPAPAVEQRAAAVARIERGVGLDHVVDEVAGDAPQAAAQGADHPGGHRRVEAERAADGDHELADAQLGRVAERRVRQPRRIGLHDRDVGPWVGTDDPAGDLPAIVQTHPQAVRARTTW